MTRRSIKAHGSGAVVNVFTAVVASPAVDTNACVASIGVEARAAVVAGIWLHQTFVYVLSAVLT